MKRAAQAARFTFIQRAKARILYDLYITAWDQVYKQVDPKTKEQVRSQTLTPLLDRLGQ